MELDGPIPMLVPPASAVTPAARRRATPVPTTAASLFDIDPASLISALLRRDTERVRIRFPLGRPNIRSLLLSPMANSVWDEAGLAELKREFGDAYGGRTVLVTGADGFMGSHLTKALV